MAYVRIRPRRSTRDEWEYYNPILAEGEMGIEVADTGVGTGTIKVKIGDGVTRWKDLPYAINLENIEDSIESISYSNNRIANYIEGRTLFAFDRLNVFPHNSLYKDMKDAINNVDRSDENKNIDEDNTKS